MILLINPLLDVCWCHPDLKAWASTRSDSGSPGDQKNRFRIAAKSLYGAVLQKLGIPFKAGDCLPPTLKLSAVASLDDYVAGTCVPLGLQCSHQTPMCHLGDCVATTLHTWWQAHHHDAVEALGWVAAAHVHAAALNVASANVSAGSLKCKKPSTIEATACHVMALKYVMSVDESRSSARLLKSWCREVSISELTVTECRFVPFATYSMS